MTSLLMKPTSAGKDTLHELDQPLKKLAYVSNHWGPLLNTAKSRELNYVNWSNLPKPLQGKGLSEEGFLAFIDGYIRENK
ncbi:hypothetical protein CGJ64_17870 [Vibrio parahaemolyticus]|nr:hypothetical protein CGJ64_17870 [Vibrio parahaemolyticus]